MKKYLSIAVILFAIVFSSCNETDTSIILPKMDYSYFPLDSGNWREFQVQEINIDAPSEVYDTVNYYLREEYSDYFVDNSGDTLMTIRRFKRIKPTDRWIPANTWSSGINDDMAFTIEENIKYIKMRFPLSKGKTWNGNAFNRIDTLQLYHYKIDSMDFHYRIENLEFDSVLIVSQIKELTVITKTVFFEQYAKNVGLIQKQEIDLYSEVSSDINLPIEQRITRGRLYYQKLIRYGL